MLKLKITKICSIENCDYVHKGHGWCHKHLRRWKSTGDPLGTKFGTPEERFWKYVQKTDTCWLWTGAVQSGGYGIIRVGKNVTAHRYSFFLHNGHWPEPMCLHSCDVRNCVNPSHLREGTAHDNVQDVLERGTMGPSPKLNPWQVLEIQTRLGCEEMGITLAREYSVAKSMISNIKHGKHPYCE